MNSGIHILTVVVLVWLGYFFYSTLSYTYVGFAFFGVGLIYIPFTLQTMIEDADAANINPFRKKKKRR